MTGMDVSELRDRMVLVMGLGRFGGGVDVARFAAGAGARVVVTDLAAAEQLAGSISQLDQWPDIAFHLGSHDPADFESADIVVANPAVPGDNRFLQMARDKGRLVTSQVGLFFEMCPARIIGITGANGKSTTTALTAHLLENAPADRPYGRVWLSGNIGQQPLLTTLDRIAPDDLVVLELSSFQIEQLAERRQGPHVALLTNLTPNHLDRYGTFDAYCRAKGSLFTCQPLDEASPAISLFNADDPIALQWFEKYRRQSGRLCACFSADKVDAAIAGTYKLPGRAYRSNLAAAVAVAECFGVGADSMQASVEHFQALPHRLELVAERRGVRWYNDSKATTPLSAMVAMEAFDGPEVLIAGGYDKHLPFDDLGRCIARKAKAAILIGQTASKIADAVGAGGGQDVHVEFATSLAEAVHKADRQASDGDVVLLSPACASYDMFDNFERRGREFVERVRSLGE